MDPNRADTSTAHNRLGVVVALLRRFWAWLGVIAEDSRKSLILNLVIGVALIGLTLAFVFYSLQTHQALCNLREDLALRAASAQKFLDDNPGLQTFRFGSVTLSRDYLLTQVKNQNATLNALDNLNC